MYFLVGNVLNLHSKKNNNPLVGYKPHNSDMNVEQDINVDLCHSQ